MVELLFSSGPMKLVYHMENPVRQDWMAVMSEIAKKLGHKPSCFVEFEKWTRLVNQRGSTDNDSVSGLLTDFLGKEFQHMSDGDIVLDTSRARKVSKILRNAQSVSSQTIAKYIQAWREVGLLLY